LVNSALVVLIELLSNFIEILAWDIIDNSIRRLDEFAPLIESVDLGDSKRSCVVGKYVQNSDFCVKDVVFVA
jgi:hypothetical protein